MSASFNAAWCSARLWALLAVLGLTILDSRASAAAEAGQTAEQTLTTILRSVQVFARGGGETLWPGYGSAPFGFLLTAGGHEELLCRPAMPAGFVSAGREPVTGCERASRPSSGLPVSLLASMPLFGPPETIVMGSPETTGRSLPDWTRTVLHEHFHQYQATFPDIYQRISALGLSDGKDGMWMLNYAFPYAAPRVDAAYSSAAVALADALDARGTPNFLAAFDRYLAARHLLRSSVSEKDWRYFELELWKEGVARWTEITLGRLFPDRAVVAASDDLWSLTLRQLRTANLANTRREVVYPLGAGEAALMEACGSAWRKDYSARLALGELLIDARSHCHS